MNKTVLRLKRETSESLKRDKYAVGGYAGYLLKVTVDSAFNIVPEIFVMQRDVYSPYAAEYTDTFYSIASVGELEFLPTNAPTADSTNFYRVSSVELMFETMLDLETAWNSISGEVLLLAEANDLSINASPDVVAIYPSDAFPRYHGPSFASPTESEIKLLFSDNIYSQSFDSTTEFPSGKYFTFAYPSSIGTGQLQVDGIDTPVILSVMNITTKYLQTVPYNVYTTEDTISSGTHVFKFYKP